MEAHKTRKRTKKKKKKKREGPWNRPQMRKSIKVAFGYFLDDFLNCLENPAGFSTATTGPAAVPLQKKNQNNQRDHLHEILDASFKDVTTNRGLALPSVCSALPIARRG
jgi:hypothetical protein